MWGKAVGIIILLSLLLVACRPSDKDVIYRIASPTARPTYAVTPVTTWDAEQRVEWDIPTLAPPTVTPTHTIEPTLSNPNQ